MSDEGYVQHYDADSAEPETDMVPTETRRPPMRGDGFDIGREIMPSSGSAGGWGSQDQIINIVQNPGSIRDMLGLDEKQLRNVTALIAGGTTSAVHRVLSRYLGDEIAGAAGGLLGGYLARKMKGK